MSEGWGLYGSWDQTESFLGQEIGRIEGIDAVELGSIRRWMEPKEFDCPLHSNADIARSAGYKDVVAPSAMVFSYGLPAHWQGGDPEEQPGDEPRQINIPVIFDVPAPCAMSFATNLDVEYFAPMYVGDRITRVSKLIKIVHKELRVGKGAFLSQEDTYTNQGGELVAIALLDIFRFTPPSEVQER